MNTPVVSGATSRFGDVTVEVGDDHIALVTMCRAPNNVLDLDLVRSLADALDSVDDDSACRAVVLTSAGRHFCAGARLGCDDDVISRAAGRTNPLYDTAVRLFAARTPIVAAVRGAAIGGGLGLALIADFRVTSPQARLAANFARLGLHHGFGMTVTLPRVVGPQAAQDLLFTGRRITGEEAVRLGLCDRLVDDDQVVAVARQFASEIAGSAPLAVRAVRRTMRGDLAAQVAAAALVEHAAQRELRATMDYQEGVRAYADRREPRFNGR